MLLSVIEYIIKSIVKHPDEVVVEEDKFPYASVFHLTLNPEDAGIVIGKRGRTINAIRNVMNAISGDKKISVEISD
jgi:predicted RNA-binding protein YlqC (UPF0109 family)